MSSEMPKAYQAADYEAEIYRAWEESGAFAPRADGEPYCIVLPPPNRTGTLHMGHATMLAVQDTLIRYHRLRGKKALWIPGTDHAAIATQVKVEQILRSEGMKDPRRELGREAFLTKVHAFANGSRETINKQVRAMGSSCDWSREKYTFDEERNRAVFAMFKRMFDDGIIERGYRLVNWDPQFQTTLSDDEVLTKDVVAKLYTFKYSKDFPIAISTTRPETKFGDTAVAVHPTDERYQQYIGQTIETSFCGKLLSIKVIADEAVDPAFGTGALGVTPAHSQIDWDMMEKQGLKMEVVIGRDGKLLPICGEPFAGKTIDEARALIAERLQADGVLEKVEEVPQALPVAERGGAPVEQLPMEQWFVRVNKPFALRQNTLGKWKKGEQATLKELMLEAVQSGGTTIVPDRFSKTYFHWVNNLRDWCISRQIWFGHQVPAWFDLFDVNNQGGYLQFCIGQELEVSRVVRDSYRPAHNQKSYLLPTGDQSDASERIRLKIADFGFLAHLIRNGEMSINQLHQIINSKRLERISLGECKNLRISQTSPGEGWVQDPDTLDTWFSSGMWTFSVFGWPDGATVDAQGNLVKSGDLALYHPTAVLETGYDILFFWVARMILMSTYALGEVPFKDVYLHGLVRDDQGRKMSKSLGNILDPLDLIPKYGTDAVRLSVLIGSTPGQDLKLSEAKIEGLRNFTNKLWNISRYILSTTTETDGDGAQIPKANTDADRDILAKLATLVKSVEVSAEAYQLSMAGDAIRYFVWTELADKYIERTKWEKEDKGPILRYLLRTVLVIAHPFLPFVTEAIWKHAGWYGMLIDASWPKVVSASTGEIVESIYHLDGLVILMRNLKAEKKMSTQRDTIFEVQTNDIMWKYIEENSVWLLPFVGASRLKRVDAVSEECTKSVYADTVIGLPQIELTEDDRAKLKTDLAEAEKYAQDLESRLSNQEFVAKAPEKVVNDIRAKMAYTAAKIQQLRAQLD